MAAPSQLQQWVLYSPEIPPEGRILDTSKSLRPVDAEPGNEPFHEEGFFLIDGSFEGWRFGLLQERLNIAGLQGFVAAPSGEQATIVSSPSSRGFRKLSVPTQRGYFGAFEIELPMPLEDLQCVLKGFEKSVNELRRELETYKASSEAGYA